MDILVRELGFVGVLTAKYAWPPRCTITLFSETNKAGKAFT